MNSVIDFQQLVPDWQNFQSVIPMTSIETSRDYQHAILLLNNLLDVVRDDANHPLYSLVSVVGDLIKAYEIDIDLFQ